MGPSLEINILELDVEYTFHTTTPALLFHYQVEKIFLDITNSITQSYHITTPSSHHLYLHRHRVSICLLRNYKHSPPWPINITPSNSFHTTSSDEYNFTPTWNTYSKSDHISASKTMMRWTPSPNPVCKFPWMHPT